MRKKIYQVIIPEAEIKINEPAIVPIPEPIKINIEPIVIENLQEVQFKKREAELTKIERGRASIKEKPAPTPSFFEKNPDIEKFIGENLINKIGIAILVLGIGFFVKFAIDQNWITEIGRVAIGIACGGILISIAHYLRKSFTSFSSVLVGGTIAVFYFTIALAFREYAIFSQTTAFILMVVITLFAVLISMLYDKQELAVLAILGGFIAPLLLSKGSGNYIVLFTYITILISGMLILAYYKKWRIVDVVSYVFTIIIFSTWLTKKVLGEVHAPYVGALCYATIFYLLFFLMNIANNIKENKKFIAFDVSFLLSNTFLYFSAGMGILHYIHGGIYQGLFTALIAVFNLVFTFVLFKYKKADPNLLYLLIGIVLTFISLAAPIQLEGNYITLFWALEAVLILWLYQKSQMEVFRYSSIIVQVLMIISLIMDWNNVYDSSSIIDIMANKGFTITIVAVISFIVTIKLLNKEEKPLWEGVSIKYYLNAVKIMAISCLYFGLLIELSYQLNTRMDYREITQLYLGIYNYCFLFFLVIYLLKYNPQYHKVYISVIGLCLYLSYLFYYNSTITELRNLYLTNGEPSLYIYLSHYILVGTLVACVSYMFVFIARIYPKKHQIFNACLWLFCFLIVFVASAELINLVLMLNSNNEAMVGNLKHIYKIGFPILWGICAFIMMVIGMRKKVKNLRIIALVLFAITLLKLFLMDLRGMSEGGKIGAFISLGVILLTISFLYQKLKKIIIEDDNTTTT